MMSWKLADALLLLVRALKESKQYASPSVVFFAWTHEE